MTNKQETLDKMEYTLMIENQNKVMREEIAKLRQKLEVAQEQFQQELRHSAKLERALKSVHVNPSLFDEVE